MSTNQLDLVIVGSVALDDLETPYGSGTDILGGSACYAGIAARHLCAPGVVGVVGDDFPKEHEEMLSSHGVDITGLQHEPGVTFHWKGKYEGDMNSAITLDTELGVFGGFKPAMPDSYTGVGCLFLGNIHPQLQLDVLDAMNEAPYPKGKLIVAADSMNLWIDTTRELLEKVISRVSIMLLNDGEARMLSGKSQLLDAARSVQAMGPQTVIIKKGEHGAMIVCGDEIALLPALPLSTAKDPTGAGDTFAGGLMGYLGKTGTVNRDTLITGAVLGTVLASYVVEEFSLGGTRDLKPEDIRRRVGQLHRMSTFDLDAFEFLS